MDSHLYRGVGLFSVFPTTSAVIHIQLLFKAEVTGDFKVNYTVADLFFFYNFIFISVI